MRAMITLPSAIVIATATLLASNVSTSAADLKVMASGAYRAALDDIIPLFEKASGHKIVVHYDAAAMVARKIEAGEAFDVVITSVAALDGLAKRELALPEPQAVVGINAASLAYRRGTAKPDISTSEALKALLLAAKTISFSDPAAGGSSSNYFASVIQRLGIAEEIQRKAILTKPGEGALPVGEGRAEIGVAQTSEIAMVPGVDGVAIFPSDPKSNSTYAAGVSRTSQNAAASSAFVSFMLSPDAVAIQRSKGLAAK
jgi:molybdate transport system substrate-binding protein